jgi:hypothetical protein
LRRGPPALRRRHPHSIKCFDYNLHSGEGCYCLTLLLFSETLVKLPLFISLYRSSSKNHLIYCGRLLYMLCLKAFFIAALFLMSAVVLAASSEDAAAEDPMVTVNAMNMKQLRAALSDRGVDCDGCSEKSEYRSRLLANWDLPVKRATSAPPQPPKQQDDDNGGLDADLIEQLRSSARKQKREKDDLRAKLRKAGINAEMFDGNDLEGILGGMEGRRKGKKGASSGKQPKKKGNDNDDGLPSFASFAKQKNAAAQAEHDDGDISDEL